MQLDSAIEERKREIENVSNDIGNEKDQSDANNQNLRQRKIELLNSQLDRSKAAYNQQSLRLQGQRYNEIATSKYTKITAAVV
jgi:hypothetical protein